LYGGKDMTYCSKCGTKNDDDAEFCKKCGTNLTGTVKTYNGDDKCEEECVAGKHNPIAPIFWGIVVILVGLWILFELVLKNTGFYDSLPMWLQNFEFWWLIGLIIALAVIITGIRIIIKK
jgi:hypothetical protein